MTLPTVGRVGRASSSGVQKRIPDNPKCPPHTTKRPAPSLDEEQRRVVYPTITNDKTAVKLITGVES